MIPPPPDIRTFSTTLSGPGNGPIPAPSPSVSLPDARPGDAPVCVRRCYTASRPSSLIVFDHVHLLFPSTILADSSSALGQHLRVYPPPRWTAQRTSRGPRPHQHSSDPSVLSPCDPIWQSACTFPHGSRRTPSRTWPIPSLTWPPGKSAQPMGAPHRRPVAPSSGTRVGWVKFRVRLHVNLVSSAMLRQRRTPRTELGTYALACRRHDVGGSLFGSQARGPPFRVLTGLSARTFEGGCRRAVRSHDGPHFRVCTMSRTPPARLQLRTEMNANRLLHPQFDPPNVCTYTILRKAWTSILSTASLAV